MKLDLFMVDPDNWGWQLCLRTGSAGFNQYVLLPAVKRQGLVAEHGYLKHGVQVMPTPDETDIFRRALVTTGQCQAARCGNTITGRAIYR
jgi:DNA polymerase/3'-5' exonuclease PolX